MMMMTTITTTKTNMTKIIKTKTTTKKYNHGEDYRIKDFFVGAIICTLSEVEWSPVSSFA